MDLRFPCSSWGFDGFVLSLIVYWRHGFKRTFPSEGYFGETLKG